MLFIAGAVRAPLGQPYTRRAKSFSVAAWQEFHVEQNKRGYVNNVISGRGGADMRPIECLLPS
jgi:hypothetical protein